MAPSSHFQLLCIYAPAHKCSTPDQASTINGTTAATTATAAESADCQCPANKWESESIEYSAVTTESATADDSADKSTPQRQP